MNKEQDAGDAKAVSIMLKVFEERIAEAVEREEEIDYKEQKAAEKTQSITRIAMIVCFLLTPFIFVLIATLIFDMGAITYRMQEMSSYVASMRNDFTDVAKLMATMDSSVISMSESIAVIPGIDTQVAGMNGNFSQMVSAMQGITPNVAHINQALNVMEQDMAQMNGLFGHLNYSVHAMGHDVNQMSRPASFMPPFFR